MTSEEKKVYEAAVAYSTSQSEVTLGRLITAVMDMPMKQWPDNACAPLPPLIVHRGPKPQPGDAAAPDTRIDLETGERKQG